MSLSQALSRYLAPHIDAMITKHLRSLEQDLASQGTDVGALTEAVRKIAEERVAPKPKPAKPVAKAKRRK